MRRFDGGAEASPRAARKPAARSDTASCASSWICSARRISFAVASGSALTAARRGFSGRGALAPAQAFEPRSFLDGFGAHEVEWRVEQKREAPAPVEA